MIRLSLAFSLALAALGCGGDPPPPAAATCALDQCGITCFDPDACAGCGNGVCDWYESLSVCPADCCDAALCDPAAGERYRDGDPECSGAPDGTLCDDRDVANGAETCRGGVCRHEHVHCRCMPQGGIYAESIPLDPPGEEAPPAADPPWTGAEPTEAVFAGAWALRRTDVSRAWMRTRGDPAVRVAIVDTGCDETLADLAGRIVATRDFTTGDETRTTGDHGTVLATVVAAADDGAGAIGMAPGVSLLCARVLRADDEESAGADPDVVAQGIDWAVAQDASIVLVGLAGHGSTSAELRRAVAGAVAADVLVVAPSGSLGGASADGFPAALPGVVSVGASDLADLRDESSDLAPTTLLLAPGRNVIASYGTDALSVESGSSLAAAVVTGAAALVRSAEPTLSAPQVRALLHRWADPVPLADWDELYEARRLDAGEAVTRASPTLVDAAIAGVRFPATSGLPGATLPVRVRVENRGVADASGVRVAIEVTGGSAAAREQTVPTLALGGAEELLFEVVPDGAEVTVTARVTLAGDAEPADDTATATIPIAAGVVHRLQIRRLWIDAPAADAPERTVHVRVENAGNVGEPEGEVRVVPYPTTSAWALPVPALAPGETVELQATIALAADAPEGRHVIAAWLLPARGQTDTTATNATLQLAWRSGHPELVLSYMQHKGYAIVLDAPWRTIRSEVPVLIYYARTEWLSGQHPDGFDVFDLLYPDDVRPPGPSLIPRSPPGRMDIARVTIANPPTADGREPLLYDDETPNTTPDAVPSRAFVTDENGARVRSRRAVITRPPLGAHRLVWLPREALAEASCRPFCRDGRPDPNSPGLWLRADVDARIYDGQIRLARKRETYRVMFVGTGTAPFPTLHGPGQSHYYDPHFHSIAETWPGTYALGPAKAFGGPLEMLVATSWSLGIIPRPTLDAARERVVTTDHNTFFDDEFSPAGPTHQARWAARVPLINNPAVDGTGSPEMDVYRRLLGTTVGEEVSLESRWRIIGGARGGLMGNHALLYQADYHVNGTWGTLDLPGCTPDVRNFVTRVSGRGGGTPSSCAAVFDPGAALSGQNIPMLGGFTFAAHPFAAPMFDYDDFYLREALSLPPSNDRSLLRQVPGRTTTPDDDVVFRGLQFWNAREAQIAAIDGTGALGDLPQIVFTDERHQNPYGVDTSSLGPWRENCGEFGGVTGYRGAVGQGLFRLLEYNRDGMSMWFTDAPAPQPVFNRKIFMIAGSDAHGDFNWTSDLLATRAAWLSRNLLKGSTFSDSAYARPRTYVFSRDPMQPASLEDMRRGRAVLTDGPVVDFELDADVRGSVTGGGSVSWDELAVEARDADGLIGGDGVLDAGGTMFVAYVAGDDRVQNPGVRIRCSNLPELGGTMPATVQIFSSGTPGTDQQFRLTPLSPTEFVCDGAWHGRSLPLPESISTPTAMVAHVSFGDRCPAIYDALTNPIWVVPVTVTLGADWTLADIDPTVSQRYQFRGGDAVELSFPISMEDQPVDATLYGINSTTGAAIGLDGVSGTPADLVPVTDGGASTNGWLPSADGMHPGMRLRLRLPTSPAFETDAINPVRRTFRMLLVVRRRDDADGRLRDHFGNPIDEVLIRFRPSYVEHTEVFFSNVECCGETSDIRAGHPIARGARLLESLVVGPGGAEIPSGAVIGSTTFTYTRSLEPAGSDPWDYDIIQMTFTGSGPDRIGTPEPWTFRHRWAYGDAPIDPPPPP